MTAADISVIQIEEEFEDEENAINRLWSKVREWDRPKYWALVISVLVAGVTTIVLGVYLGIFGYADTTDPDGCFYIMGMGRVVMADEQALRDQAEAQNVTIGKGYPLNIAHMFRIYFRWGFWNVIAQIIVLIGAFVVYRWNPTMAFFHYVAFSAAIMASALFHFFLGMAWRFSEPGRLAAGEFLEQGEKTDEEW